MPVFSFHPRNCIRNIKLIITANALLDIPFFHLQMALDISLAAEIQCQPGAPTSKRVSSHLLCIPLLGHPSVVQRNLGAETAQGRYHPQAPLIHFFAFLPVRPSGLQGRRASLFLTGLTIPSICTSMVHT